MRTIELKKINGELTEMILEKEPLEEDIGIVDSEGKLLGVIIPEYLYRFLEEKVEEAEDEIDIQFVKEYRKTEEYQNELQEIKKLKH